MTIPGMVVGEVLLRICFLRFATTESTLVFLIVLIFVLATQTEKPLLPFDIIWFLLLLFPKSPGEHGSQSTFSLVRWIL